MERSVRSSWLGLMILLMLLLTLLCVKIAWAQDTMVADAFQFASSCRLTYGTGSPEGAVVGSPCDEFRQTNASGVALWVKVSGSATNTGWQALGGLGLANTWTATQAFSQTTGSVALRSLVTGDSYSRFYMTVNGVMWFGDGSATQDVNLYRNSANLLKTDDNLSVGGGTLYLGADVALTRSGTNTLYTDDNIESTGSIYLYPAATTSMAYAAGVTGDTYSRYRVNADGLVEWGSGSAARDVNLYRSAANVLKTDDDFTAHHVLPATNNTYSLGAAGTGWLSLYLGAGGRLFQVNAAYTNFRSDTTGYDGHYFVLDNRNTAGASAVMFAEDGGTAEYAFIRRWGSTHPTAARRFDISAATGGTVYISSPTGIGGAPHATNVQSYTYRSGAKTATDYALSIDDVATSSTASVTKAALRLASTGTWNGASAVNIGLLISTISGGTSNYAIYDASGGAASYLSGPLHAGGGFYSYFGAALDYTTTSTDSNGLVLYVGDGASARDGYWTLDVQDPTYQYLRIIQNLSGGGEALRWRIGPTSFTPGAHWTYDLAEDATRVRTLYAAELNVWELVARTVTASIGGEIWTSETTKLTADLASGGTTITVYHNNLANGDRIVLKSLTNVEWMAVASAAGGSAGAYTYTVTRNLDGTGANAWVSGQAVVNTGTTGNGFISQYAESSGALSGAVGPATAYIVRTGTTWSDLAARAVVGNLDGTYGYSAETWGFAAGDPSDVFISAEATNGFRISEGGATIGQWATDGSLWTGVSSTSARFAVTSAGEVQLYDTSNYKRIALQTTGEVAIGANLGSSAYPGTWISSTGISIFYDANNYFRTSSSGLQLFANGTAVLTATTAGNLSLTGTVYATAGWFGSDANDVSITSTGLDVGSAGSITTDEITISDSGGITFDAGGDYDANGVNWSDGSFIRARTDISALVMAGPGSQINFYSSYMKLWGGSATGDQCLYLDDGELSPGAAEAMDLGSLALPWGDGWFSGTLRAYDNTASIGNSTYYFDQFYFNPSATTNNIYPLVWDDSSKQVVHKTDGTDGAICGSGVDALTLESGIVTGYTCASPATSPAARITALEAEVAALRAMVLELMAVRQ